jgi:hypothetical protein
MISLTKQCCCRIHRHRRRYKSLSSSSRNKFIVHLLAVVVLGVNCFSMIQCVDGFVPLSSKTTCGRRYCGTTTNVQRKYISSSLIILYLSSSSSSSSPGNFFDDFQKLVTKVFFPNVAGDELVAGTGNRTQDDDDVVVDDNDDDNDNNDDDEMPAGITRIVTIPVQSIKLGGLRLLLMFHLLGQQNNPQPKSWRADQPIAQANNKKSTTPITKSSSSSSPTEYVLDMYYRDHSAALTISLYPDKVTIDRVGSTPSNSYMMHETIIVEGILLELQQCATDENVAIHHRLLVLPEANRHAIDEALGTLSFG